MKISFLKIQINKIIFLLNNIKVYTKRTISGSKYSSEIYFANIFRDTITDSPWLKTKSFSPGRWAMNYLSLYVLYRILNNIRPNSILECGLGESSKLTVQYAKSFNKQLSIVEHNKEWINFFITNTIPYASKYIIKADLDHIKINNKKSLTYKNFKSIVPSRKYDLVIIDGPYGSQHYSRPEVLEILDMLSKNFILFLDDNHRLGEKETAYLVMKTLEDKKIPYKKHTYFTDKGICLICSPEFDFLGTL